MKRWYVIHTQARSEAKASHHLIRQGFSVYLPQYLKARRHARKSDWVKMPLFARYLFVSMDVVKDSWYSIKSTVGVSHLICDGDRPLPIADGVINDIRAREDENGLIRLHKLRKLSPGDSVQILGGAFHDQIGIFDCSNNEERVNVLLKLLGRSVRISLPIDSIVASAS